MSVILEGCAADPLTWAVEWSPDQRCIHIITLGELLETNRALVGRTHVRRGEYLLIAIFETHAEAEAFAGTFETKLRGTSRDVRTEPEN